MMRLRPTVFERIIRGELPCAKVYEDEHVFAFMDAGQLNPGHVLVATRKPYVTLMETDEETAVAMMRAARMIARAVQAQFQPDGMTILQANELAGWQTVPHCHLHVLPRYIDDGVGLVWPRKEPGMQALLQYAEKIRASSEMPVLQE
ncbi:HIT family protein [Undibacterium terreum]|uniref:Cell-cycle regulation protein HIT n=1 Tax=Undibacterium terreum TaxID=1224302 RepID=A0A916UNA1_9BURK|nr:HIT family protein [Undibacterium terreum]GGC78790.1 cell-cycle regulation protein HIT [Undibacterium terreum]